MPRKLSALHFYRKTLTLLYNNSFFTLLFILILNKTTKNISFLLKVNYQNERKKTL